MIGSAIAKMFSGTLEKSPIVQITQILDEFTGIESFKSFEALIQEIHLILKDLKDMNEPNMSQYLELPLRYLKHFQDDYSRNLRDNPDILLVKFEDTLKSLETILNVTRNMCVEFVAARQIELNNCSLAQGGTKMFKQKTYNCLDCKLTGRSLVCEACALNCHSGHKVKYLGEKFAYCDCMYLTDKCQLMKCCTFKVTKKSFVEQEKSICKTCGMKEMGSQMLCNFCVDSCHKGHDVVKINKFVRGFCDCDVLFNNCAGVEK